MINKKSLINKSLYLLILIIFIIGIHLSLHSQTIIQKVDIPKLNRVLIYCSTLPAKYSSKLSDDKKKVSITIKNASVQDSAREVHNTGIIEDVYVQTRGNSLDIMVLTKEKRGYTAIPLPYSQSIMVEVFQWDKLTRDEDFYRQGLLALEYGIIKSAKDSLQKAYNFGNPDAAAILGILNLQEGRIASAIENFRLAYKKRTDIPDAYSALSHIFKYYNFPDKSDKFAAIFYEKTGLNSFPEFKIPILETDSSERDEGRIFKLLYDPIFNDSLSMDSTNQKDSSSSEFQNLFAQNKAKTDSSTTSKDNSVFSFIPPWLREILFWALIISAFIALIIRHSYLRWKKKQILDKQKASKNSFHQKLQNAKSSATGRAHAAKVYKESESIVSNDINLDEIKLDNVKDAPTPIKQPVKTQTIIRKEKFEDKLEKIANELIASDKSLADEGVIKADIIKKAIDRQQPLSAKLQLAMHLQEEQRKIQKRNIASLNKGEIPTDINKLSEVAKNLGIEKSALEAKRKISELESDKNTLSKLAEKFSVENKEEKSVK